MKREFIERINEINRALNPPDQPLEDLIRVQQFRSLMSRRNPANQLIFKIMELDFTLHEQRWNGELLSFTKIAIESGFPFKDTYNRNNQSPLVFSKLYAGENREKKKFIADCSEFIRLFNKTSKTNEDKKEMEHLLFPKNRTAIAVPPDISDVLGNTLLQLAVQRGDFFSFSLLMEANANNNTRNNHGITVLDSACLRTPNPGEANRIIKQILILTDSNSTIGRISSNLGKKDRKYLTKENLLDVVLIFFSTFGNFYLSVNRNEFNPVANFSSSLIFTCIPTLISSYIAYDSINKKSENLTLIKKSFKVKDHLRYGFYNQNNSFTYWKHGTLLLQLTLFAVYTFLSIQFLYSENSCGHTISFVNDTSTADTCRYNISLNDSTFPFYREVEVSESSSVTSADIGINLFAFFITGLPMLHRKFIASRLSQETEQVLSPTHQGIMDGKNYYFTENIREKSLFACLDINAKSAWQELEKEENRDARLTLITLIPRVKGNLLQTVDDDNVRRDLTDAFNAYDAAPDQLRQEQMRGLLSGRFAAILADEPALLEVIFKNNLEDNTVVTILRNLNLRLGRKKSVTFWRERGQNAVRTVNFDIESTVDNSAINSTHILHQENAFITLFRSENELSSVETVAYDEVNQQV